MGLQPVSNRYWCPRPATTSEQASKIDLLRNKFSTVLQATEGSALAQSLLARELANRYPNALDALKPETPTPPETADLIDAALRVPEDLCLLQRVDEEYLLVAACVTAPSYWYLPDKVGSTLAGVHDPVPGLNRALGQRMKTFFTKLPKDRTFMRRNWFLHHSASLFQPAAEVRSMVSTATQAAALTIRSETQTLRRLHPDVVVFTIAVECHTLADIKDHPMAARSLLNALHSRTNEERTAAGQNMYEQGVSALLQSIIHR